MATMQPENSPQVVGDGTQAKPTHSWQALASDVLNLACQFFTTVDQALGQIPSRIYQALITSWNGFMNADPELPGGTSRQTQVKNKDWNLNTSDKDIVMSASTNLTSKSSIVGSVVVYSFALYLKHHYPDSDIDTTALKGEAVSLNEIINKPQGQTVFIPLTLKKEGQPHLVCLRVDPTAKTIEYYSPQGTSLENETGTLLETKNQMSDLYTGLPKDWTVTSNNEVHEEGHANNGIWVSNYMQTSLNPNISQEDVFSRMGVIDVDNARFRMAAAIQPFGLYGTWAN